MNFLLAPSLQLMCLDIFFYFNFSQINIDLFVLLFHFNVFLEFILMRERAQKSQISLAKCEVNSRNILSNIYEKKYILYMRKMMKKKLKSWRNKKSRCCRRRRVTCCKTFYFIIIILVMRNRVSAVMSWLLLWLLASICFFFYCI